jgi:hypothetical protein
MAGVPWLLISLILVCAALRVSLGAAGSAVSANGRYTVDLSTTPKQRLLVAAFREESEGKKLMWSRAVPWQPEHPGFEPSAKALVSNDGKKVVLRERFTGDSRNGVAIVDEEGVTTVQPFTDPEVTGAPLRSQRDNFRPGVSYQHVPALLDFMRDEEGLYVLWFGQTDRWVVIWLDNPKLEVPKSPQTIARLNEMAHQQAEAMVLEDQPPALRRIAEAARAQFAKLVPSLAGPQRGYGRLHDSGSAYLFLAARHRPEDKHYIEGLALASWSGIQSGLPFNADPLLFTFSSHERTLGDYLLGRWNGLTNCDVRAKENHLLLPMDYLYSLGAVTVKLDLGIKMPDQPGALWAYAIPAALPPMQWTNSSELAAVKAELVHGKAIRSNGARLGSTGYLNIRSLTPGSYRLKLVWERHPPPGVWRTNIYLPQPGDYESVESAPVTVVKGQLATVTLACTNRVGGVEAYKEDEEWVKETSGK